MSRGRAARACRPWPTLSMLASCLAAGCASAPAPPPDKPVSLGADDAILAIGKAWESRSVDKGLRSSPSPIASFESTVVTRIELVKGEQNARQTSSYLERFVMRDGEEVHCETTVAAVVVVGFGRRQGEAALEIGWPGVSAPRVCQHPDPRVPPLEEGAGRSRFVLRSDQLVGVEPALEKRSFLPID